MMEYIISIDDEIIRINLFRVRQVTLSFNQNILQSELSYYASTVGSLTNKLCE